MSWCSVNMVCNAGLVLSLNAPPGMRVLPITILIQISTRFLLYSIILPDIFSALEYYLKPFLYENSTRKLFCIRTLPKILSALDIFPTAFLQQISTRQL